MDIVRLTWNWSVMWNEDAICSAAGATIEEETGEMNVNEDTVNAAAHFCFLDQLGMS